MPFHRAQDIHIRDPFVLPMAEEGNYYLFGTTDPDPWNKPGIGFDSYVSKDLVTWEGPHRVFTPPTGFWGTHDFWAPEVHRYQGKYYLFATFITPGRKRGTHILVADQPLGPYLPLGPDPATPKDWQCLDGTLYLDEQNEPWLVFCHEWVEVNDGEIWAQKFSQDLTCGVQDPILLFRASEASWPKMIKRRDGSDTLDARVTDGPYVYRAPSGDLLMVWSSLGQSGYAMGWAKSASGTIQGPWIQHDLPLIAEDGGHGMLFETFDGQLQLTYHKPNRTPDERFHYQPVEYALGKLGLASQ